MVAPLLHRSPIKAAYTSCVNAVSVPNSGIGIRLSINSRGRLPENQGVISTGTVRVIIIILLGVVADGPLFSSSKLVSKSIHYVR